MMQIDFETIGSAFEERSEVEITRILRDIARHIEFGHVQGRILDINGNTIGSYAYNEGEGP